MNSKWEDMKGGVIWVAVVAAVLFGTFTAKNWPTPAAAPTKNTPRTSQDGKSQPVIPQNPYLPKYPEEAEVRVALAQADEALRLYAGDIDAAIKVAADKKTFDGDLLGVLAGRNWIQGILDGKTPIDTSTLYPVLARLDDASRNASVSAFDLLKQDVLGIVGRTHANDSIIKACQGMNQSSTRLYQASNSMNSIVQKYADADQARLKDAELRLKERAQ